MLQRLLGPGPFITRVGLVGLVGLAAAPGCGDPSPTPDREAPDSTPGDARPPTSDASLDAATSADAQRDTATDATPDARTDARDAGPEGCDPSAVRFVPPSGSLRVGQLCDDIVVCAADATDAARITASAPSFQCSARAELGCSAWTCLDVTPPGPRLLDQGIITEICRLSVLSPAPRIACFVYL